MRGLCRWSATTLVTGSLLLAGCGDPDRPEHTREAIPAGVDVGPPRTGAETGGLAVPGREPTAPMQAGDPEPLTDTVGAVFQQPGEQAPAQPQQTPPQQ